MDIINRIPKPILEALKEAARIVLMAVVSYGIAYLTNLPQTESVLIGTIVLRAIDKWLHEYGKDSNNDRLAKGLAQF